MADVAGHWHYAVSMPSKTDPALIETMTSPETGLGKDAAKRMLQPSIRRAQGIARYEDPDDAEKMWEPADWWMHHEPLEWLWLPTAPDLVFAVYSCGGHCVASAIAFRDELAAQYRQATGRQVEVQSPN